MNEQPASDLEDLRRTAGTLDMGEVFRPDLGQNFLSEGVYRSSKGLDSLLILIGWISAGWGGVEG